jgi:hypothetical protein
MKMSPKKITWMAAFLVTLTEIVFTRRVRINADGTFTNFWSSADRYPNVNWDSHHPKSSDQTDGEPDNVPI